MRIDNDRLYKQLTSPDASERMAGIHTLQEDLSEGNPELPSTLIRILEQIAASDSNSFVKTEARRLLQRDEYLDLYKRLNISLPAPLSQTPSEIYAPIGNGENILNIAWGWGCLSLPAFLFLIAIVILVNAYFTHKTIQASTAWPDTMGEVTASGITVSSQFDILGMPIYTSYKLKITYRYNVSGDNYYCNVRMRMVPEENIDTVRESFSTGTKLNVSYNPDRPQNCVSEYDEDEIPYLPFILIMVSAVLVFVTIVKVSGKNLRYNKE